MIQQVFGDDDILVSEVVLLFSGREVVVIFGIIKVFRLVRIYVRWQIVGVVFGNRMFDGIFCIVRGGVISGSRVAFPTLKRLVIFSLVEAPDGFIATIFV